MGSQKRERVIILFNGAGAAGTNALLGTLVRLGLKRHEVDLLGARNGFAGLVSLAERFGSGRMTKSSLLADIAADPGVAGLWRTDVDLMQLDHVSIGGLHDSGGIVLGTSRCPEFYAAAVRRDVIKLLENLGVDAVIVCGGDGSMAGARCLANESDLKIVGIPATLDNELPVTESALGVDTALNTLSRAVGHLGETAGAQHGIMVLEVMGRTSSELTRLAALVLRAAFVVTPEQGAMTMAQIIDIAQRLEQTLLRSRCRPLVLMAEGVSLDPSLAVSGNSHPTVRLAHELEAYFRRPESLIPNMNVRPSVPGHLLRTAAPSAADCILAARFAEAAWRIVMSPSEPSGVLGLHQGMMQLHEFDAPTDAERVEMAEALDLLQRDLVAV